MIDKLSPAWLEAFDRLVVTTKMFTLKLNIKQLIAPGVEFSVALAQKCSVGMVPSKNNTNWCDFFGTT